MSPSSDAKPWAHVARASVPECGVPRKMIPLVHANICRTWSSGLDLDLTSACTELELEWADVYLKAYILDNNSTHAMHYEEERTSILRGISVEEYRQRRQYNSLILIPKIGHVAQ